MEAAEEEYLPTKEQVLDQVPKRIKALRFGLLSPQDIAAQSVVTLRDREVYQLNGPPGQKRVIRRHGPNDERMGTSSKAGLCETCGHDLYRCNGHFGHVKLALPVFHYGYMKKITEVLNCICKECSRILLPEKRRREALHAMRRPDLDSLRRIIMCKSLVAECKKVKRCPSCSALNGPVKRVAGHPVKMVHNKFAVYINSKAKGKQKPQEMLDFEASIEEARRGSNDVERNVKRALDDMHPLRVLNIFRRIPNSDVELLGMDPHRGSGRPEYMIWTHLPAPPVAIRPSVAQEQASTEDDLTNKLGDIIEYNNTLRATLTKGQPLSKVMEIWEYVQVQCAMVIDGNVPGLARDNDPNRRSMRGLEQRLKGKQGRFRGNLSGKRVDFSGRTVISPDPNLGIDEVAVPARVAMNMTYPEKVTKYNIEKLKKCVQNGDRTHPGANFVDKHRDGRRLVLRVASSPAELKKMADKLEIGDTVVRHLEDGDIVLFNRQPSLHKLSILSHRVKVRPWRTFRLNECVCNPYNADFDGDEMNLHVPQTEEARTEAMELMGVKHNLATPKNGTPIIAAIQDFITAAYLLTQKDRFFTRSEYMQVVAYMYDGMEVRDPLTGVKAAVRIPPPAIYKPQRLWTGKQVWDVLLRPHASYPVIVNLDAKGKQFVAPKSDRIYDSNIRHRPSGEIAADMSENDSYLVIRNSEVMCGITDKATIGDGKKDSIFYVIMRDAGPEYAVASMNRLAKLSARWLTEQGFSIGISDVYPSDELREKKSNLVRDAYEKCAELIHRFQAGKLERDPGCDEETTLENKVTGILNAVRAECGDACLAELSRFNAPLTMAKSGAKGSNINVSQMVAAVGQQIIGGKRVVDGFEGRTLPHFVKGSREPSAKGFVVNSFFSGLNPAEFIFHAMSGREGLVDTAVKTAETGYMSRRLMKSLEDLSVNYDETVRNSAGGVVQVKFGDDGLDPVDMEGSAKPVNYERSFMHAMQSTWDNTERGLTMQEVEDILRDRLRPEMEKLVRRGVGGVELGYDDESDRAIDQQESARDFLREIEEFVSLRAKELLSNQQRSSGLDKIFKISRSALELFIEMCLRRFEKSKVEPGHAVGAVGAQSIGEPGTQMTLKTFHFAGLAGMHTTQGVPRIKEIINASKKISTPVITCALDSPYEEVAARFAKAVIQKTYLKDIAASITEFWPLYGSYIKIKIDWARAEKMGLRIGLSEIVQAIEATKGFKTLGVVATISGRSSIHVLVDPGQGKYGAAKGKGKAAKQSMTVDQEGAVIAFETLQMVRRRLPGVVVKGYPEAVRAVMKKDEKPNPTTGREPISVYVEGYGLKQCMNSPGVDGTHTTTNSVMEMKAVLGIEAARATIISEIGLVMKGMDIDPRHMQLLADVMTYKGEVLGITRFGLAKMRDSVLQLASFEKTPDHLFDAAIQGKRDEILGVSESVIMGQGISLGTGAMKVYRSLNVKTQTLDGEVSGLREAGKKGAKEKKDRLKAMRAELETVVSGEPTYGAFVPMEA